MNVYNDIQWLVASSKILDHSNHDGGWLVTWVDWKNTAKVRKKQSENRTMRIINAFPGIGDSTTEEGMNVAIWNLY